MSVNNIIFIVVFVFGAFWIGFLFLFVPRESVSVTNSNTSVGSETESATVPHAERVPLKTKITYPTVQALNTNTYPKYEHFEHVIERWNPDDAELPATFTETLQHFDYSEPAQRKMALAYRNAELPFKIYNVPEVDAVSLRWTDDYLEDVLDAFGYACVCVCVCVCVSLLLLFRSTPVYDFMRTCA